jgi:hypothetical protein
MKLARLNGWQRIGVVISAVWLIFVVYAVFHNYQRANVFDVYSDKKCAYDEAPFFSWYDDATGQPLSDYAFDAKLLGPAKSSTNVPAGFLACDDVAKAIDDRVASGSIVPYLHLNYGYALQVALAPIIIFWTVVYVVVFTFKWVVRGFRGR